MKTSILNLDLLLGKDYLELCMKTAATADCGRKQAAIGGKEMKRTGVFILGLLAVGVLGVILTGCMGAGRFSGSRVVNQDGFQMEYSILNQRETAYLELAAGDALRVTIRQETGSVDVLVSIDGEEPVYEGNGLADCSFSLNISETGRYLISVTGHKACGSVTFVKN